MFPPVKLVQLETFVVVAEELHFRRAAERLFTQPSSVSSRISQLEAEYGTQLFIRNSRQVRLIPAGEILYEKAKSALAGLADLEAAAKSLATADDFSLSVANFDEGLAELTTVVHRSYQLRFPKARVTATAPDYRLIRPGLLSSEFDVAILDAPSSWFEDGDDVAVTDLWHEPTVAVLPISHSLADRNHIVVDDLVDEPFLLVDGAPEALHDVFTLRSLRGPGRLDVPVVADHLHNILSLVAQGIGVMTVTAGVPRYYVRPDVRYVPISDRPAVVKSVVTRASDDRPHIRAFVDECVAAVGSSLDLISTATDATGGQP